MEQPSRHPADLLLRHLDRRHEASSPARCRAGEGEPAPEGLPPLADGLALPELGDRLAGKLAELLIAQVPPR